MTTVFSAYVTATGQAWADFDVYMPERWARDLPRRRAAGIPEDLEFATKPQLAMRQLDRLTAAGLPASWSRSTRSMAAASSSARRPRRPGWHMWPSSRATDQVTLPSGTAIRADQAVKEAVFERRSCGNGSKGPRYSDWAMTATAVPGQYLIIRRPISRPDQLTFYLCWAPPGWRCDHDLISSPSPAAAGPREETFKTGKDVLGWDQSRGPHLDRHTAGTPP